MDIDNIQKHCNSKKGVTESFPFDETTLVFKVANKMFCLASIKPPLSVNLKCNPEKAIELREEFEEVTPGYHMNKQHWNTVMLDGMLKDTLVKEWIDDSYNLIVSRLPKKTKESLK